jgi:hypothetical protein
MNGFIVNSRSGGEFALSAYFSESDTGPDRPGRANRRPARAVREAAGGPGPAQALPVVNGM